MEYTKVRKNGIEDQILTHVIEQMGRDKFQKLGWEILPSEPMEVQVLKKLKAEAPKEVEISTEPVEAEVEVKSLPEAEAPKEKRAYNKKK